MNAGAEQVVSGATAATRVDLMGLRIDTLTRDALHERILSICRTHGHALCAHVNVHAMNLAWEQPPLRAFFRRADMVFCDGHGVMLAARLQGDRIPEKITYAAWLPHFAEFAARRGLSLFLLGGRPGVAERAAIRLKDAHTGLIVAGVHDGYFDKCQGGAENQAVVRAINAAAPDVLLVAFGMPLQEYWLAANGSALRVSVALTGGAALDYMAGEIRRPPRWLTACGFEWFGRMVLEPRRLWRRYLIGNPLFYCRWLRYRFDRRVRAAIDAPV